MYSLDCLKAKNEEKLKKCFILVQSKKSFARFESRARAGGPGYGARESLEHLAVILGLETHSPHTWAAQLLLALHRRAFSYWQRRVRR